MEGLNQAWNILKEIFYQTIDFFRIERIQVYSVFFVLFLLYLSLAAYAYRPLLWWRLRRQRRILRKFPIMSRWQLSALIQRRLADRVCEEIEDLYMQRRIRRKDRRWAYAYLANALELPDLKPRPTQEQVKSRLLREQEARKKTPDKVVVLPGTEQSLEQVLALPPRTRRQRSK